LAFGHAMTKMHRLCFLDWTRWISLFFGHSCFTR